ncbi:Membrane metalloprotease [Streptococcus dysgalactiae subsp. equisimilis AC-2713]|uniref:Membrane metalloprotease n=1 Tax=Streptococcus dysgalactiae subsp. equisimilis AC-2713 TaxID=759913 RepID=A0AB33R5Q5_STREQ|nr:hypothetical protein HMPREF9964_1726 [Streptococcus dysgalactiae subsp. equisimilis SK1249]EGR87598.1 hypothetical protein HMPREF9963_0880 [Streptococcus dysgalactiae subsp. equisimilis SK1250]CCI62100.1 Membrane metalloprotease [Streptococcus dysgalactiae subsp. equisimilis AC-2713]
MKDRKVLVLSVIILVINVLLAIVSRGNMSIFKNGFFMLG